MRGRCSLRGSKSWTLGGKAARGRYRSCRWLLNQQEVEPAATLMILAFGRRSW